MNDDQKAALHWAIVAAREQGMMATARALESICPEIKGAYEDVDYSKADGGSIPSND